MTFEPRSYRRHVRPEGLVAFEVVVRETDLQILAEKDLSDEAFELVVEARAQIEGFAAVVPRFAESFVPVQVPRSAPLLVKRMAEAAYIAGVGPMAAVAGAVAEFVAIGLTSHSREVVVENGGDDFLVLARERIVAVHAGHSPLSERLGLRVDPLQTPLAIATSSATVGPSVSLGSADAVTILAHSGALADAVASAAGNRVHRTEDIESVIEFAASFDGVVGAVIVLGGVMGAWGEVDLVPLG
jgi:ApbE superfamily uncharacterized protein (UPF0280 family)